MSQGGRRQAAVREFAYLALLNLLDMRGWGLIWLLMGAIVPLSTLAGFILIGGTRDAEYVRQVVVGSGVMALVGVGLTGTSQEVAWMKESGQITYYATLPIRRVTWTLALVVTRYLITLPGLLVTLWAASRLWEFQASFSMPVVAVALLAATSLSGVGMALGMVLRPAQLTAAVVQVLFFLIMFLSPVLVPPSRFPPAWRTVSGLLPSTHAARAMSLAVAGQLGPDFWLSVAVLLGFTAASLALVHRAVPWRLE